ncbi:MAG TPA: hypothetical protein VMF69_28015 [Gemmataceae bacterium]|nr:hypothetical protein [Gemmataceae bacterium]
MKEYVVYRHGWNTENQSPEAGLPEKMPVARIEANDPEDACRRAMGQVTLQAKQYLSAEPADEVDARENNLNLKAEALEPPIAP